MGQSAMREENPQATKRPAEPRSLGEGELPRRGGMPPGDHRPRDDGEEERSK